MLLSILSILFLVTTAVLIHFEALNLLTSVIPKIKASPRLSILIGILGCFCAHLLEVSIFAGGFYFFIHQESLGSLLGGDIHGHGLFGTPVPVLSTAFISRSPVTPRSVLAIWRPRDGCAFWRALKP